MTLTREMLDENELDGYAKIDQYNPVTVRRIVQGEGVERIFPFHSPAVQKVSVRRPGRVRRAKLYYLRERVGKATKVKERREDERKGESVEVDVADTRAKEVEEPVA